MLSALRNHNSLPASLRELVILRVAVLNRAPYEFDAHAPIALAVGVSQACIDLVQRPSETKNSLLSTQEQLAIQLTDAMTRDIEVPEALFAEVKTHFGVQEQIDLVAPIAAYNMVSRFLVALRIGH